jgi:hypothetical protein
LPAGKNRGRIFEEKFKHRNGKPELAPLERHRARATLLIRTPGPEGNSSGHEAGPAGGGIQLPEWVLLETSLRADRRRE